MERGRFSGFDHIDARVRDLPAARSFYDVLMPAPGHIANDTCVAFTAATPGDVDRLAQIALGAGARDMEGPEIPYSSERYYAVFFRDPGGNRLEICYRRAHEDRSEAIAAGT